MGRRAAGVHGRDACLRRRQGRGDRGGAGACLAGRSAWKDAADDAWNLVDEEEYPDEELLDDDDVRMLYLEAWLGRWVTMSSGFAQDEAYARHACLREWLRERGYEPDAILPRAYMHPAHKPMSQNAGVRLMRHCANG